MLLSQVKVSFKRLKHRLATSIKGSDEQPEHDVRSAVDVCSGPTEPASAQNASPQQSLRRDRQQQQQQQQQGRTSRSRQVHDQAEAHQPSLPQPCPHKAQQDCDVYLAVPGSGSASPLHAWRHQADCACSDCAAQCQPSRRRSLNSPLGLASVAEAGPMLIAACAGDDGMESGCYDRLGACYTTSSGSRSSSSGSVGDDDCGSGSQGSMSRGSSWGGVAGSSEEWSAEAVALQAACDEALRACSTPPAPPCLAAQSPVRAAVQQHAAKGLASPLGGFLKGLLGRTRSAPMTDGGSLGEALSAVSAMDCSALSSSSTHAQAASGSCNTSSQLHLLETACSMPNCGTAGMDGVASWGPMSPPAAVEQQQQRNQPQPHLRQSPFGSPSVNPCKARSSAPMMVAVEPLQPPAATQLLAVSAQLPRRMARSCWSLADFSVVRRMYKGTASSVYHATDLQSGMSVALKVYHMDRLGALNHHQVYREVRLHAGMVHENIIRLYAAFQEGQEVVMVQEYAEGGDLYGVLHRSGGRLSERQAVELVLQPFLLALHYMHTRGILHRDIKPENVLFTSDRILKVADFGLAIDLTEEHAVTRAGTLDYMAPEVLRCPAKERPEDNKAIRRLQYTNSVDAWAVGVFAYELVVGFPPFASNCASDSMERIMSGPSAVVFPRRMSDAARGFISDALQMHPGDRPTVREMLVQPWVAQHSRRRSMRVAEPFIASQVLTSHRSVTGAYPLSPCAGQRTLPFACPPLQLHTTRSARQSTLASMPMDPMLLHGSAPHISSAFGGHLPPVAHAFAAIRLSEAPSVRRGASPPPQLQLPARVAGNATCALLRQSAEALQRWEQACRRAGSSERPPLYPPQAASVGGAEYPHVALDGCAGVVMLVPQTCS